MESHSRKVLMLGTLALPAKRFKAESLFSIEDLRARRGEFEAAEAIRLKKAERARYDEHSLEQPDEVKVDAELIGRHVEVLTATQIPVVDAAGNDSMMYGKKWLPAVINKISDGKDTKLSANKNKIKAGWFFLEFDDGECLWTRLLESQFNCRALGSWRFDLDFLVVPAKAQGAAAE